MNLPYTRLPYKDPRQPHEKTANRYYEIGGLDMLHEIEVMLAEIKRCAEKLETCDVLGASPDGLFLRECDCKAHDDAIIAIKKILEKEILKS